MSSQLLTDVLEVHQQAEKLSPQEVKQYRSSIRRLSRMLGHPVSIADTDGLEFRTWFVQNLQRQRLSIDLAKDFASRIQTLCKVQQSSFQAEAALAESEVA